MRRASVRNTTNLEQQAERDKSLEYMRDPAQWVSFYFVPLKRRHKNAAPEVAVLRRHTNVAPFKLVKTNMLSYHNLSDAEKEALSEAFNSLDEIISEGWVVD